MRATGICALAGALLLAGCGGERERSECGPAVRAGTDPRSSGSHAAGTTFLTAVRLEGAPCVDRVTFEFRAETPEPPGFRAQYVPAGEALVEDGSGNRIDAEGSAFLVVRLEPAATADSSGDALVFTYTGPRRLRAEGTRRIREVVKSGDFEAAVTWVIALSEERPFRILTSGSPPRVVVEVD